MAHVINQGSSPLGICAILSTDAVKNSVQVCVAVFVCVILSLLQNLATKHSCSPNPCQKLFLYLFHYLSCQLILDLVIDFWTQFTAMSECLQLSLQTDVCHACTHTTSIRKFAVKVREVKPFTYHFRLFRSGCQALPSTLPWVSLF